MAHTLLTATPEIVETLRERLGGQDVTVVEAPETALITAGVVKSLSAHRVGLAELPAQLHDENDANLLVIDGILDVEMARRLEDLGIGFVDAGGSVWLPGWPRTPLVHTAEQRAAPRLAPSRIRAAQILADHPHRRWTERSLAAAAHVSPPTAHHLMRILEDEGLIERRGQKRGTTRRVRDTRALRRWLARSARPGRVIRLPCFLREIRTGEIDDHRIALSGAAAATHIGAPVLTSISRTLLRVALPDGAALDDVPALLGGFRTTRGANAFLVADKDQLGTTDAWEHEEHLLAPTSRIMLDLYLEPREPVDLFLDLWGDQYLMSDGADSGS